MKKKKLVNTSIIPYEKCYEASGMINNGLNRYSVSYRVRNEKRSVTATESEHIYNAVAELFSGMKSVSFQFVIRNAAISKEDYLNQIKIEENKDSKTNEVIRLYNNVLAKNIDIGHNNYKTDVILTISLSADNSQEAETLFEGIEEHIVRSIELIPGFKAEKMSLMDRLGIMFDIYNPDIESELDAESLGKVSTKEVICPSNYDKRNRNYLIVGKHYVRMFFINNVPNENTDTLLHDLISVSNNSILSVVYQPIDSMIGYSAATRAIKGNTEVLEIPVRRTIEDRKLKRVKRVENVVEENERDSFTRTALDLLRESAANEEPLIQVSFIIGLYADTLEELDRDTKLLKLSASKYSCQIKTCDYVQHEAFQSVLPLGETKIDVSRVFNIPRISKILPVNVNVAKDNKPTLEGLNAINDNMVFIDRSKYQVALITGRSKTGKTYELKREVVNTLISTDDSVVIVTGKSKEYEKFARCFDTKIYKSISPDLFGQDGDYGLAMDVKKSRSIFLEAFITAKSGFYKRRLLREELKELYKKVEENVGLINEMRDYDMALDYIDLNPMRCELFRKAVADYKVDSSFPQFEESRVNIVEVANFSGFVTSLDYIWNYAIKMKKQSKNLWIYLDGIDEFLQSETTSDYFISILDRCERLKVPVTFVLDEPVKIVADEDAVLELEYMLKKVSLFKLLSLGPIERKYLSEKLNVSKILVPYITDREPKEGIIISLSLNIAFNDHFESNDEPFFEIFN